MRDTAYDLRESENKLNVPLLRTNYYRKSFSYNSATLWNNLPCDIRNTQYIDDRYAVETIIPTSQKPKLDITVIRYCLLELLTRLGYTVAFHKSWLSDDCTSLRHLGFIIDSAMCAYLLPEDTRSSFALLRDQLMAEKTVSLKMLQRFVGKCISMALVVPGASLYTREMNRAISYASHNSSTSVKMYDSLFQEIAHWRFLDSWNGCLKWRDESHHHLILATDASLAKYGVSVLSGKCR